MKLTADDLEGVISWNRKFWPILTDKVLAVALLNFIESRIAGQQGDQCPCNHATCAEPWEPGCGLGTTAEHARAVPGSQPSICETCNDHGAVGSGENSEPYPVCATVQPLKTYTLDEILDDLGPEHRAKVEKRFKELLADYNSQEPVNSSQSTKPAGCCDGECTGACDGNPSTAKPAGAVPIPTDDEMTALIENTAAGYGDRTTDGEAEDGWYFNCEELHAFGRALITGCEAAAIPQQPAAEPAFEACPECGKVGVICKKPTCAMLSRATEPAGRQAVLGFARPADLDGVRRNKDFDASIGVFVQPRRTETHSIPLYTTPSPEPAVEATGTVNGYLQNARAVEIILDDSIPRWIVGYTPRVTISPTGGKSDA